MCDKSQTLLQGIKDKRRLHRGVGSNTALMAAILALVFAVWLQLRQIRCRGLEIFYDLGGQDMRFRKTGGVFKRRLARAIGSDWIGSAGVYTDSPTGQRLASSSTTRPYRSRGRAATWNTL
jgi:hypothetical protein